MDDEPFDIGLVEAAADPAALKGEEAAPVVTATVIPAEAEPAVPLPAVREATKVLLKLPDLTQQQLAGLAREIAMDIKEVGKVLKHYGLTEGQYEFLKENTFFAKALEAATIEWNGALSTPERLRIEAAAILEDSLPKLGARMSNSAEPLAGVVEAGKLFAKIANVGERDSGNAPTGEKFNITINLGADKSLEYRTAESAAPGPVQLPAIKISTDGQGQSGPKTVLVEHEGKANSTPV